MVERCPAERSRRWQRQPGGFLVKRGRVGPKRWKNEERGGPDINQPPPPTLRPSITAYGRYRTSEENDNWIIYGRSRRAVEGKLKRPGRAERKKNQRTATSEKKIRNINPDYASLFGYVLKVEKERVRRSVAVSADRSVT